MTARMTLSPAGVAELELVLAGGLGSASYASEGAGGRLQTTEPLTSGAVEMLDQEGTPLAVVEIDGDVAGGACRLLGPWATQAGYTAWVGKVGAKEERLTDSFD